MKVKIKSFNGELPNYFTIGKEYEVKEWYEDSNFYIVDDDGDEIFTKINSNSHLNGGSQEIVE